MMAEDGTNGTMDTSGGANDDDRKLFAGGLAQEATEKDITDYFCKYGEVTSVNLKMDQMTGRSRGFAFVVFKDVDTLTAVLSQDHAIKGKKVAVKRLHQKEARFTSASSKTPPSLRMSLGSILANTVKLWKSKGQLIAAKTVNPRTFASLPSTRRNQQMHCSKRVLLLSTDKKWRSRKLPLNPTVA